MSDRRTDKALEALADLFLTGSGKDASAPPQSPTAAPPNDGAAHPVVGGNGRGRDHDQKAASEVNHGKSNAANAPPPRPIPRPVSSGRDAPPAATPRRGEGDSVPTAQGGTHRSHANPAPLDRPIAMTVPHEDKHGRGCPPLPSEAVHVEGIVLGNLPGLGRPWLAQYGQHLSRCHGGAVAMLELATDQARLELVDARPRGGGSAAVEADTVVDLITGLLGQMHLGVKALLVNLPQPLSPRSLAQVSGLPCWTVCCGTDQAAMQNAINILTELHTASGSPESMASAASEGSAPAGEPASHDAGDRPERPPCPERWGVMLMGCDESRSQATARQLAEQARLITGSLALRGYRRQMQPVQVTPIGEVSLGEEEGLAGSSMPLSTLLERLRLGRGAELEVNASLTGEPVGPATMADEQGGQETVQLDELYRTVLDGQPIGAHSAARGAFKTRRDGQTGSNPVRLSPKLPRTG